MKRLIAMILAVLILTGCTPAGKVPAQTTTPANMPDYAEVENPVTFFSMTLGEDYENIGSLTAFLNEDGTAYVEYVGEIKKVGTLDANIFHGITATVEASGLAELNGQNVYADGEANGSMYITYEDGAMLACGFGGEVPKAYRDAYAQMGAFFRELTAQMPEYVPQPQVLGEVEESILTELTAIIGGSGIQNPDAFSISPVVKDEFFAFSLGLSSEKGIASAALCQGMMMTTAYSLAVVRLEEGADTDAVCADFAANVDWMKWVCVMPDNAMVAVKDDLVLCLVAEGQLYSLTAIGIEEAGWTVVETMENPN